MPRTASSLSVSLIGAGNVGRTLGALLQKRGHGIVSVITRNPARARSYARSVHCTRVSALVSDLSPRTDLLVIAVPDEEISGIAGQVAGAGFSFAGRLTAFHASGALTSDALAPLANAGARIFSLHPIQTFPAETPLNAQLAMMRGIWYGFEGNDSVRPFARSLVRDMGGKLLTVPKEEKNLYHIACVFASNYPVALVAAVESLSARLQMRNADAFRPLVETAVRLALDRGASSVLTGPVSRGSAQTVREHLKALKGREPGLRELYSVLGLYALEVAVRKGRLSREQKEELTSILSQKP